MSLRNEVELFTKLSGEDGLHTSIGRIGAYLDGYKKGKSEAKWIPVSERLPDKEGNYLMTAQPTYNHTKDIRIAHWSGRWVGYNKSEILAWMPLPEPYREEGD